MSESCCFAGSTERVQVHQTGVRITDPGPVIMTRRFDWEFEGSAYDQEESYFLVRTTAFEPFAAGWSDTERATMRGHHWWSIDELRATKEEVFPHALADLVEQLLAAEDPLVEG